MSDSRRCSSADSENECAKITKIYSRRGAASNMFRDTSANSMSSHTFSHFELHILPNISKTVCIPAKTPKNLFPVKILTHKSEYADFRQIKRAKT
jgi:hypothetical protein